MYLNGLNKIKVPDWVPVKPGHEMYLNSAKPTNPPALYPR